MKIIVVGANGRLGHRCVSCALAASHQVVAFVRSQSKFLETLSPSERDHSDLIVFEGDALNLSDLSKAMSGCDAVMSVAGWPATFPWGTSTFPQIGRNVIDAARDSLVGARKVWLVTGFNLLDRPGGGLMMDSNYIYAESRLIWEYAKQNGSDLSWSICCPSIMVEGDVQTVEAGLEAPPKWGVSEFFSRAPVLSAFTTLFAAALYYKLSYHTYAKYMVDHLEEADERLRFKRVSLKLVDCLY